MSPSIHKLKVYVLVDNCASSLCRSEHGLSYLVEFDKTILFDTGQSDLFIKNAKKLEAPINNAETIILSHGHYDHGNGLFHLQNKNLIAHPNIFDKRYSGKMRKPVGLALNKVEAAKKFKLTLTKEPVWISENMVFLGEIPRKVKFENNEQGFFLENNQIDPLKDDSAMVVEMSQGLFIISGCSHSGICNIIEHAKKVTQQSKIYGVMGGFHLKFDNKQTHETLQYFENENIKVVMPSHCTELPALSIFYNSFKGEQVKAGTLYTFENQI